jgi:UDP-N-acetyl-2-amino-2-deoxyglucuronate dehydrogenase
MAWHLPVGYIRTTQGCPRLHFFFGAIMQKVWRVGVVGVGVVGTMHVRLLAKMSQVKLVAICDTTPQRARDALAKHSLQDIPVYDDQAKLLESESLDVLHIATPSGDHLGPAMMAMKAGLNVVCEKPLEIKLERIDEMIAAAQKNNVRLAGIFQNRWSDANRALKSAAQEGRFGTLAYAGCFTPWYRTDQYYREAGWRGTWNLDGGGAVMNQSVHSIDLLQWIAGPVKCVSAYSASRIHPDIEVEDTMTCSLQFASGAFGLILGTTAMYPGTHVRIEIGGSDGSAVAENGLKLFKFREARPADQELVERLATRAPTNTGGGASATDIGQDLHYRNINAIYDAWAQDGDAETAGPEARKSVAIVRAMYESARKNGASVEVS